MEILTSWFKNLFERQVFWCGVSAHTQACTHIRTHIKGWYTAVPDANNGIRSGCGLTMDSTMVNCLVTVCMRVLWNDGHDDNNEADWHIMSEVVTVNAELFTWCVCVNDCLCEFHWYVSLTNSALVITFPKLMVCFCYTVLVREGERDRGGLVRSCASYLWMCEHAM